MASPFARGIPTVAPWHRRIRAGPGESFRRTGGVEDGPLGTFIETRLPSRATAWKRRIRLALAEKLGELMAKMHAVSVVHHDLHAGNLLLRLDRAGQPELYLIDLHAVRLGTPLGWKARRDNLIMLNRWFELRSDRPDRLRFWRAYARTWHGDATRRAEEERQRQGRAGGRHLEVHPPSGTTATAAAG